jgi:hypothetical protein
MAVSVADLDRYEREATYFYYLWFIIYLALGLATIILPGLAAMGIDFGVANGEKYIAGSGALAAAMFGFLKPNDYAAAFDAAIAEIRSLRTRFDSLPPEATNNRLDVIFNLMAFKYQGSLPSNPKSG